MNRRKPSRSSSWIVTRSIAIDKEAKTRWDETNKMKPTDQMRRTRWDQPDRKSNTRWQWSINSQSISWLFSCLARWLVGTVPVPVPVTVSTTSTVTSLSQLIVHSAVWYLVIPCDTLWYLHTPAPYNIDLDLTDSLDEKWTKWTNWIKWTKKQQQPATKPNQTKRSRQNGWRGGQALTAKQSDVMRRHATWCNWNQVKKE